MPYQMVGEIPEKQIVTFLTKERFLFATLPQEEWSEEGWTLPGDVSDLRQAYTNFHPDARRLLDALEMLPDQPCMFREPMPKWASGYATLLRLRAIRWFRLWAQVPAWQ